jgi:hypothetical protein
VGQRNKPPVKKTQQRATSKAGQLVDYRDDLLNLKTARKFKLPHLTGEEADKAAAAERQKNKTLLITQSPGEIMSELLFIYQYQD